MIAAAKPQPVTRAGRFAALVMVASVGLAACGGAASAATVPSAGRGATPESVVESNQPDDAAGAGAIAQVRALILPAGTVVDDQGAVEVAVTPLGDQSAQLGSLVFEVVMNTHSVELGMDLAARATLTTDNGLTLTGQRWTGGEGHHVTGLLLFPLPLGDDGNRLATANRWRLTLRDLDTSERTFEWNRP